VSRSCAHCGKGLGEGTQFCPQCGARVAPVGSDTPDTNVASVRPPAKTTGMSLSRSMVRAMMLCAIVGALTAGWLKYKLFTATQPAPTDQPSEPEKIVPPAPAPAKPQAAGAATVSYSEWKPSNAASATVPLVPELTVITAIAHPTVGDYESIKRIQAVNNDAVEIAYSSDIPGIAPSANSSAAPDRKSCTRIVQRQDLRSASQYRENFCAAKEESYPGSTAISVSAQILADLKSKGEATFQFQSTENGGDPDQNCALKRVEAVDVGIPVLVNDRRMQLPAVHGRCVAAAFEQASEFYILDDADNPLCLAWQLASSSKLQVIKIAFPTNAPQIEQALEQTGRAEVYGIYFDFGSASIRPESEPVLKEIAGALAKNPSWKLSIEGHTDAVGGGCLQPRSFPSPCRCCHAGPVPTLSDRGVAAHCRRFRSVAAERTE
jgi:zinc ribbon protein